MFVLQHPLAQFDINAKRGYQETVFLDSLNITLKDLEPKANMCTEVGLLCFQPFLPNFFFSYKVIL